MGYVPRAKPKRWQKKRKRKDSKHKPFYQSKWWKTESKQFIKDNPICIWYGKRAKCTKWARITDHRVAMTDGGSRTNKRNWQPMCKSCSQAKTNMEVANRKRRIKGVITPKGLR